MQEKIYREPAVLILATLMLSFAGVVTWYLAFGQEPARFTTQCVGPEVMVITSNKTHHFDLFYSPDCK